MNITEKYLVQLQEIEIISGTVPIEIFNLGSKEVWLLNLSVGKFIRKKLFKRAMYLQIDDPKHLRRSNGSSSAQVRQYDFHIKHVSSSRVFDKGRAHLKWRMNPLKIGWFSTGTVFDIFDFSDMKTLKSEDYFRLRIQQSRQEIVNGQPIKEPTREAEIYRITDKKKR